MKKIRLISLVLTVAMLVPVFTSCSAVSGTKKVIKKDDPWFDSFKFKLEKDIQPFDAMGGNVICTADDKLFNIYCLSKDKWGTVRTVLDTYGYDGAMLDRVELFVSDETFVADIYNATSDPEGNTIKASVFLNSYGADFKYAFVDIDTKTGKVSNIKEILTKEAKSVLKPEYAIRSISSVGDYTVVCIGYFGAGLESQCLLYKDQVYIAELDTSNTKIQYLLEGFTLDEDNNSIFLAGYEDTGELNGWAAPATFEFDAATGKLKNKNSVADQDDKKVDLADFTCTGEGDLCKIDSLGNIIKYDKESMTAKTVIESNWYTPYLTIHGNNWDFIESRLMSYTESRAVIVDHETKSFGMMTDGTRTDYVTVLNKADENPHAGKKIVELALPPSSAVTDYLAKAVFEFNNSDDEYIIRIWDKNETGFTLGRFVGQIGDGENEIFKLIQDLKGNEAPDLVLNIQKSSTMRDDIFMDMTGFLDPEVYDKQYKNIIEACRFNGKQYILPVSILIEGLVTNKDILKDGAVGMTFDEFDKMTKEDLKGYSPYDYPDSVYYNKESFILSCIDTKRAIESENIDFGTDQFRAALEYAKDNFDYDDRESTPIEYVGDWDHRKRGESYYKIISDFLVYVHACNTSTGYYVITGTPSVDASGPRFSAAETISVSANTDVKDGCRKFINYLFSGAAFKSDDCELWQIVTNKEIMDKVIDTLTKENNDDYDYFLKSVQSGAIIPSSTALIAYGDKEATENMKESFTNSMATISTYSYEDPQILKFLKEEIAPYYAGDRSINDTIKFLNDRASKYIREQ